MNKQLLLALLVLFALGCGDDLGWEHQQGSDCESVDTQDAGDTDAADSADVPDADSGSDDGDSYADGTDSDEAVAQGDDATETVDDVPDVADADVEVPDAEDVADGSDESEPDVSESDADDDAPDADDAADAGTDAVLLPPECTEATACDDGKPCTVDTCGDDGKCAHDKNLFDGIPCDTDESLCTLEKCLEGKCLGAGTAYCEDNNPCTDDLCDSIMGCEHWPNIAPCEDGNACTVGDGCENGTCVGGNALTCDDGNDCSLDVCDLSVGCTTTDAPDGTPCADGFCFKGYCGCKAYGCAAPTFAYSGDVNAGMLGGMGGNVGPKMGCAATDILIGISFDFSTNTQTATRTTIVCGTVTADQNGNVTTTQTTTQTDGGSGCYGWAPWVTTPIVKCPSGWAIVGMNGVLPGTTLFHSVSITCEQLDVGGNPNGVTQTLAVPNMAGDAGTPQTVNCPAGTIARYFETRAGCGQDALTLYCAKATPDCTGQTPICKE